MKLQKTLGKTIRLSGPSACSDAVTTMTLIPAREDSGIVFMRTDIDAVIPLQPQSAKSGKWTRLEYGGATIETTEHILAALRGMEIDNALIALDAPGVPLMDGSSLPFVEAILEAGYIEQDQPARVRCPAFKPQVVVRKMVSFRTGAGQDRACTLVAIPSDDLSVEYLLQYENTALPDQFVSFDVTPEVFAKSIAPARTFMTPWEIERWGPDGSKMLSKYFCDTVQVVCEAESFVERIPNEAAAHKALDIIGDMAVFGHVAGRFLGVRSGHALNGDMIRRLSYE